MLGNLLEISQGVSSHARVGRCLAACNQSSTLPLLKKVPGFYSQAAS